MLTKISHLPESRFPWLLLAAIAFALEAAALTFQYAFDLAPCIMCIYQRTAVLGIFFAGAIGAIAPSTLLGRLSAFAVWGVSSIWGYLLASEHLAMQQNTDPFAFAGCAFEPNFPSFLPLHHWFPWFFEATGDCGQISWQFLGLSMPAWMEVIFALFSLVFIAVLIIRLATTKKV